MGITERLRYICAHLMPVEHTFDGRLRLYSVLKREGALRLNRQNAYEHDHPGNEEMDQRTNVHCRGLPGRLSNQVILSGPRTVNQEQSPCFLSLLVTFARIGRDTDDTSEYAVALAQDAMQGSIDAHQ